MSIRTLCRIVFWEEEELPPWSNPDHPPCNYTVRRLYADRAAEWVGVGEKRPPRRNKSLMHVFVETHLKMFQEHGEELFPPWSLFPTGGKMCGDRMNNGPKIRWDFPGDIPYIYADPKKDPRRPLCLSFYLQKNPTRLASVEDEVIRPLECRYAAEGYDSFRESYGCREGERWDFSKRKRVAKDEGKGQGAAGNRHPPPAVATAPPRLGVGQHERAVGRTFLRPALGLVLGRRNFGKDATHATQDARPEERGKFRFGKEGAAHLGPSPGTAVHGPRSV